MLNQCQDGMEPSSMLLQVNKGHSKNEQGEDRMENIIMSYIMQGITISLK